MDVEKLRALIRAAIVAAPLSACGATAATAEPAATTTAPREQAARPEPPSEVAAPQAESLDAGVASRPMDPAEFERQWRQHLRGHSPEAPATTTRRTTREIITPGRPLATTTNPTTVAELVAGPGWSSVTPREQEPRIAAGWLAAAQVEHASVASFARAALELTAVGAPAQLLTEHLRAGVDEVEHARLCFELAASYGAADVAPAPLPTLAAREATLERVAVDTFLEGCVNETAAALAATRAAQSCEVPRARAALERIAEDEARHAALAWRTVRWTLEADPKGVGAALRATPLPCLEPRSSSEPSLRAHGLLDEGELERAVRDVVERIVRPMRAELVVAATDRQG